MSVHYKFKSALEYDTVTFDGLHISVRDLKKAILHQKRIGKNTDFDLQVTNAQTKEVYTDDGALIPKNTSLIVARIPLTAQQKKAWDRAESNQQLAGLPKGVDTPIDGQDPGAHRLAKAVDLSSLDASEEDKIQAMMTQSTQDYNPVNYMKIRGAGQMGEVPSSYRCFKCHQPGHWIKNCPLGLNQEPIEIKKSTGIPRSFMVPVEGPGVPGAMMTPTGQFAVPAIDHQAYKEGKKERPPFQQEPEPVVEKPEIPEDLLCNVCKDLLTDAVMIPCCGNSFCDECIRTVLLESEDHECPDCNEKDVSPDTLIPNRFLRNNVNNFKNATGYNKSTMRQPVPVIGVPPLMQQMPSEPSGPMHEFTDAPAGDVQGVKVEVITSTGIAVHPPRLHQPVPSTIPVLGSSSHVERGPVVRQPQPGPPSSGLIGPPALPGPVQHGGPPLLPPDTGHGAPPIHIQDSQRGHPLRPQGHPPPSHLQLIPQPPGVTGPPVTMQANGGPLGPPGVPLTHVIMPPGHEIAPHQPSQGQQPPPVAQQPQHVPGMHPVHSSGPRRSVEERPGTPTIDEHNQDIQSAPLPDTSVPPPNFPPGEEPSFSSSVGPAPTPQPQQPVAQPIETLGARFQHRMPVPHSYRGEHPYGPIRNFAPRGSHFEHGHPSYHHESGSLPGSRPPHYADLDRDGHPVRGSFRGYHRGRGRIMHGGYRGGHIHHQPPPPGLGRGGIHNGNQAGTIDDPLEAFERMLREKDERDHKLRRSKRSRSPRSYSPRSRSRSTSSRSYTRSRSRSRTRSRTRSRSRTPRSRTPRSRTPRKRSRTRTRTRSRSRSFTISRSRSRTFSRSPTPRPHSPRGGRDYSPRRRASPRYRTPPRSPPRFQRPYKEVRPEFEPAPYYEPSEFQYTGRGGGRGRGGRFGQRKDYGTGGGGGKDYYDENYSGSRFGLPLSGSRDMHHRPLEPLLPHPPGVAPQNFRRYEHFDMAPPGTGPDIPGIGSSYEKPRYERNSYENRPLPVDDFLTPPGVDHRYRDRDRDVPGSRERDIGPPGVRDRDICPPGIRDRDVVIRDRDMGMPSMRDRDRDIGPPGVRDRDLGLPLWESRDRGSRDDLPPGRDGLIGRDRDMGLSDRSREKDRDRDRDVRERDGDRDRDRGRGDYYDGDHRRSYDKSYSSYNSPDVKKRKQSLSPGPGRHERYSSSERHHRRGGDRRKNSGTVQVQQGGKENRHMSQQQPVETVVDAAGGQRERDKDTQKRERVLVEVRKEPSVDRLKKDDKGKKEEDNKKGKDKKKKKKEKEPEGEKLKKKRRKEKKEGKKEGQEPQEKMKVVVKGTERKMHHKEKEGEEKAETEEDKVEEKLAATSVPVQQEKKVVILTSGTIAEKVKGTTLRTFDAPPTESIVDGLYGDMEDTRIDDSVIANYGKVIAEEAQEKKVESDTADKGVEVGQEVGDGVELKVKADTGSDSEGAVRSVAQDPAKANVMLAPLPEPSKWELEEEFTPGSSFEKKESEDGIGGGSQADKAAGKVVTSEVLKRAENAIFQKAINAIRPIEPPKKMSGDRKVYASSEKRVPTEVVVAETVETRKVPEKDTREARKTVNSIQITIPTAGHVERSVEIASLESSSQPVTKGKGKLDRSKFSSQWGEGTDSTSPHRVPAKERLGARVDGDGDRKKEDNKESKRHRSRSESRERKHAAAKKGLKSAIEKKHTISRSHSRSPHHRKESKYAEEARRYDVAGDRRYLSGDSRSKRGDREGRYADMDRERRPLDRGGVGDSRRREHSESKKWDESREKKEIIKSPERRRERSDSHEAKVEKTRSKPKEEREKSVERGKARHKAKKKTKNRRSESRSRKKSVSDRESKRSKKKDKKHKKEKGKKHKQRDEKTEKKESENGKEEEEEAEKSEAVKEVKAGTSNDAAPGIGRDNGKIMEALETAGEQSKDKPRKGGRRNPRLASDRKKSTLDEASFEPDYDASSSVDTDADDGGDNEKRLDGSGDKKSESNVSPGKKRDRSASIDPAVAEQKRQKLDKESDKSEKATTDDTAKKESSKVGATKGSSAKKRDRSLSSSDSADDDSSDEDDDDSSSGSSSSSDDDSSDDSSVHRRRKKKSHHRRRKRSKKASRRASNSSSDSESESESASSSDSDGGRGRKGGRSSKKHRHRSKVSKKKKKSSKHR